MKKTLLTTASAPLLIVALWYALPENQTAQASTVAQSDVGKRTALLIRDRNGALVSECPLKRTDVKAEVSGPMARVTVTQEFENKASDTIEAVYVFPLPHNAAVDDMSLQVGARTVKGSIRRREEAQAVYEAARNAGRLAGLLEQERPNIFTQSVANIPPGGSVRIVIRYVERLTYEAGTYEWAFPTVVGPRYIPGATPIPAGNPEPEWRYDSSRVPDANRITPPVTPPATRAGHDISLQLTLDAGVPVDSIECRSHEVVIDRPTPSRAAVRLRKETEIPNRDFVLRWDVAGKAIKDAVLAHNGARGGYFSLILQPPESIRVQDTSPKEIVFVLDTSGSMSGFPIEKSKEAMKLALNSLNEHDTFNLITFAGDTRILFPQPARATRENLLAAQTFLSSQRGSGGTEMMKAIRAALAPSASQNHIRIVCFMTDGYVGNEDEIIAEIRKYSGARVFSFGIGNAVNRYLLDKMAEAGRGEVEYVSLADDGSAAARRFHERVRNPLLTDISIEWNNLPVADILPARVPDLFSAKPVVISGRFAGAARGTVRLRGKLAGAPVVRDIPIELPAREPGNEITATLWARTKVDSLMHEPNTKDQITQLGLDYRMLTPFTAFVAVEETVITEGGKPRRIEVPVETPDGVSHEGIFGPAASAGVAKYFTPPFAPTPSPSGVALARQASVKSRAAAEYALANREPAKLDAALTGDSLTKLTSNGTVRVQIWLADTGTSTMAKLKQFGFQLLGRASTAKVVIGRIAPDKLKALSELSFVIRVAPATGL